MKKYLLIVLAALLLCSCEDTNTIKDNFGNTYEIATIDSCEYILRPGIYSTFLTHKGNCKYCQKRLRKMIKDI